jgi:hypothetical protein
LFLFRDHRFILRWIFYPVDGKAQELVFFVGWFLRGREGKKPQMGTCSSNRNKR